MLKRIHANYAVSISELKRNPQSLIDKSQGEAIALLNRNKPTAYIIPAETYEDLLELIEDIELGEIIEARREEKDRSIEVPVDEL